MTDRLIGVIEITKTSVRNRYTLTVMANPTGLVIYRMGIYAVSNLFDEHSIPRSVEQGGGTNEKVIANVMDAALYPTSHAYRVEFIETEPAAKVIDHEPMVSVQLTAIGEGIIELLSLRLNEKGRVDTSVGDKNALGLALTVRRLYEEGTEWLSS